MNISSKSLSRWENRKGVLDLSLLISISKELRITVSTLISVERRENKNYQENR